MLKILETPRDAMQGLQFYIPVKRKVELMNSLLRVGFDILDIGSLVSAKAVPQMADTLEVINNLEMGDTDTKLFVLVVSAKGAEKAAGLEKMSCIGFPFSPSQTFLKKNINSDFENGMKTIEEIQEICLRSNKIFIVYLSMAFGNPYRDPYEKEFVFEWVKKLFELGIRIISLSDITGIATPPLIKEIYSILSTNYSDVEFGIHLHTKSNDWYQKLDAAYKNGCKIFDGVINGLGGCPMSGYELLGNLPTANIIDYAEENNLALKIDMEQFSVSQKIANTILA